ncbi:transcriptional regulator, Spx/MgsR family [Acinetobacter marinus]|uniref:Transcriptional regulator, Spx/MgsR family n=1 Tax=Acinetobacter marinus TaxID=281375 RepID=A0A1G6MWI6_9GAMM|nr:arsenate reductase [Acinetobacter marinus]SDC59295.1 transcriptional regulator, Spx/MgsR family [Acinetobacter marinus]
MITIYGIKNCNTMKKAFQALDERGVNYQFHDYKKQGIDEDTLKKWLAQAGQALILNKKGTTWKKLSSEQQEAALADEQQLIATLMAQPSMIKRPVLDTGTELLVGFDEAEYAKL